MNLCNVKINSSINKNNMKNKLLLIVTAVVLLSFPRVNYGQAPTLGTTADFVLFSSVGAASNVGTQYLTLLTGHVGANGGSITNFGNVDGNLYAGGPQSAACAADLTIAYNQLNATIPTIFPGVILGTAVGQTLTPGVHSTPGATTLDQNLILDGLGNPNAVFIFKIQGPLSTNANSKVKLINGTKACNVFWKVEGLVDMATGTTMRGTVIANNAAINMATGDTLEGRALAINGAVTVSGIFAYTPIGCGSPVLVGPLAPTLASTDCYALFSSIGPVTNNVDPTFTRGDVGTNSGLTTGFNPLFVTGAIHPVPDGSTALCATDLNTVYNYLNALPTDIILMAPTLFGHNLVLTPHTYLLGAATALTDTLYLDAQGSASAVFVIQINGAFMTSTNSRVILRNGAQAKNVYWKIDGAVDINGNSIFNGSIIAAGAINLQSGVLINGRALTINGALNTSAVTVNVPLGSCGYNSPLIITEPSPQTVCEGNFVSFIVGASGTNLTYQWRKGIVNLINGGNISGATSATLTINPASIADAATNYNVIVNGSFAPSDTSINVSLVVNTGPIITSEPSNQVACPGGSASFVVAATGSGLTYQWKKGLLNLINGGNILGANSATLTINPVSTLDTASNYYVVITGACPPNDTSINVFLRLNNPIIITEPTPQAACIGSSASFSVSATGTGLNYQWRIGAVNLINGGNISGANTATLAINPVGAGDAGTNYNVVVSGACAPNDTSINVSLIVGGSVITTEPINKTACEGSSVSFSIAASGSALTYQWKKGTVNLVGANIFGANTATLTINPVSLADAASNYNVVVSGACAPNDTSVNVTLSVNPLPVAVANSNSPVCVGSSINLTAQAVVPGTYFWSGPNSYTSTAQNPSILSASLTNAGTYSLTATNSCGSSSTTAVVAVNNCDVDLSVVKTVNNANPIIGNNVVFTIVATNSGTNNATGVEVNDILQDGYAYIASSVTTGIFNPSTGVWTIGNMNIGTSEVLTVTVTVIAGGNYVNTAIIYGNEPDLNMANNVSSIETFPTDFFIPEGFSPNGDGINDVFVIRGISNFPDNKFDVFNRWGNKVFDANPYKNTWDGKATKGLRVGGDELPVGTYFYILDLGDGTPVYKGTIYLNR